MSRDETVQDEDSAIAGLLEQLYDVISFEEGGEPNWRCFENLFSPHAHITRITPEGTDYLNPASFVAMTRDLFEVGAYTSFYEFEVARKIQRFGKVAQVWSLYETRRNRAAGGALGRGVNSIQLIREGNAWQVLGLLWDETRAEPDVDFNQVLNEA